MKVLDIDMAMALAAKDPLWLRGWDYVMDEGGWFVPTDDFIDWLLRKRPATARAVGVRA